MPSDLPSRFPLARCTDLDEFLPLVHQAFGVPRSHPVGPMPRRRPYELRGLREPQFTIGLLRNAIGVSIDGSRLGGSYFINVGVSGTVLSERGGERLVNCPDLAAMFNPGDDHLLLTDREGAETLGIRLDHSLVSRELAMLLGREPDGPVAFDFALDLTAGRTAALRPVIDTLLGQLNAGHEVLRHPVVRLNQVRTFVTTLLLTHRQRAQRVDRLDDAHPVDGGVQVRVDLHDVDVVVRATQGDGGGQAADPAAHHEDTASAHVDHPWLADDFLVISADCGWSRYPDLAGTTPDMAPDRIAAPRMSKTGAWFRPSG